MFSSGLIVFRETLEAALIVGILAAATQHIEGRSRWITAGIAIGIIGALIVASATGYIAQFANGIGQEILNAAILGTAVLMLAWHNIWMVSHSKQMIRSMQGVAEDVRSGTKTISVILIVVALAVLREGSETALFLYGISAAGGMQSYAMLLGGLIGGLAGAAVGYLLFVGLLRIPLRWFFSATTALILLLAAGLASQAAGYLIQAGILPSLVDPLWDTSSILSERSTFGTLLHSLIGYTSHPSGMQVVFYIAVLVSILLGMKLANRSMTQRERSL